MQMTLHCWLQTDKFLQKMVTICEQYGTEHNIVFSTDPNPAKSKTKCVLFSGKTARVKQPVPIILDGKPLPWVEKVEHLGHVLLKTMSMDADCSRARGSFMGRASDIRENMFFADPDQKMKAISLYCCDGYGSMLWDLQSDAAESYFKAWNVQSRLAWDVSYKTHTYLVENYFCDNHISLRNQIFSRYPKFAQKLKTSPSSEIRFLFEILVDDARSQLCKNLRFLKQITKVNPLSTPIWNFKTLLPRNMLPQNEQWRIRWLDALIEVRKTKKFSDLNLNEESAMSMLKSLCIT